MDYFVAVEYRVIDGKKVWHKYIECETLEIAQTHVAKWAKILKPSCDLFDVRIYEITNY